MATPAKQPLEKAVQPGEASNPKENPAPSSLNSPKINSEGKPTQRAITTAKQAHAIAKKLRERAKTGRIATAAVIAKKYNGEPPFNEADLSKTGQAWRNNFSTNFLASIIDRVKPQMLDPLNKADVLTHSTLPGKIENAAAKSRIFCEVTTKVVRRWAEWRDFASQLAQENVLFGLAVPAWIDNPTEWRPRLWRFDEAYLPEGTGQHASKVQFAVFTQKMLLHDFLELFRDRKLAEKACYNFENCIKAANNTNGGDSNRNSEETDMQRVDRMRETGTMLESYDDKAKTVDLFHVLVRDYSGGVDLWTVTQDEGLEIRCVEDLHEEMPDALTLFTFQSGNGKLYGSKGLGRLLTNLHIAIERGRCLGADQMYLSGLVIFKSDKKDAASLQARVRHPFIFMSKDIEVITEQIEFHVEAFEMMDAKLTKIAESIAGAFIPSKLGQDEGANTKIEAAQDAEREQAVREGVLGRFFEHVADLMSAMQRKIYCDINLREGQRAYDKKLDREQRGIKVLARKVAKLLKRAFGDRWKGEADIEAVGMADEDAVSAIVELLDNGLTIEDIATLALSPSAQNNASDGAARDAATLQYIANNRVNPNIDQSEATKMEANIAIGEDRAKQIVINKADPQVEAIAIREQLIELSEMLANVPMPVAASDKHETHRKVLASKLDAFMQSLNTSPSPETADTFELVLSHYKDHINFDQTMPPEQKQAEAKAVDADLMQIKKVRMLMQRQAQQAAAQGATGPTPAPLPGQPPQVGPDGQIIGEDPNARQSIHPEDASLKLEVADRELRSRELDQKDAELALKSQDQEHRHAVDALKLHQDNMGMVQEAHKDAQDAVINDQGQAEAQAQSDADRELQRELAEKQAQAAVQAAAAKPAPKAAVK